MHLCLETVLDRLFKFKILNIFCTKIAVKFVLYKAYEVSIVFKIPNNVHELFLSKFCPPGIALKCVCCIKNIATPYFINALMFLEIHLNRISFFFFFLEHYQDFRQ